MQINNGGAAPSLPPSNDKNALPTGQPTNCWLPLDPNPLPGEPGLGGPSEKPVTLAADKAAIKADQKSVKTDQSAIAKDQLALTKAEAAAKKSGAEFFLDPAWKEKAQLQKDHTQLANDQGKLQRDEIKEIVDEFLGKFPTEPPSGINPPPKGLAPFDPRGGLPIGLGGDKVLPGQGTEWFN